MASKVVLTKKVMYRWCCDEGAQDSGIKGIEDVIDSNMVCQEHDICNAKFNCYPIKITIQRIKRIPKGNR